MSRDSADFADILTAEIFKDQINRSSLKIQSNFNSNSSNYA